MVEIKQQLVPLAKRNATYGTGNPKLKMVVHQTGNTTKGANAQVHANLQSRGYSASWHIQSDDKEIIQSWPFEYRLWHASTGNAPNGGNMVGIGWEICINEDGDYLKSLDIAAKGIAKVMKQEGIPMSQLTTHNAEDPKNKWCPAQILSGKDGVNWNDFKAMVQKAYNGQPVNSSKPVNSSQSSAPSTPKPSAPSAPKPELKSVATIAQEVLAGKWGNGDERKRRLEAAGYNYNSVQNEVNKSASAPSQPSKPKLKSVATIAQEVIDNKWGNGDDRKRRLEAAGYNYNTVQAEVNKRLGATKSVPKPAPKPVEKIERKYAEKGTFTPNQTIDVYDKPSTNGKKLVQYKNGESVIYHTVHIGNGNVWVQYTRAGGKGEGYLPIRSYINGKYGAVKGKLL